jgi:ribonucleoside-diphosphate reductase alpha chain
MAQIAKERLETGRIYIMNIDHVNKSPWKEKINMTNLCVEITQPTQPLQSTTDQNGEIGICILSAINLLEVKLDELENVCKIIVYALNELIDYQEYPFEAARRFCQEKRSLGIGLTNFAAWLASKKLNHESLDSIKESNDIMERVQYYLLSASCKMAEETGAAPQFYNSHYSDGMLPCDKERKDQFVFPIIMDWENLRDRIKQFGLKNCTVTAQMPCESSSVVQCSTNGLEPIRSLLTEKEAKNGVKKVLIPRFPKMKSYYSLAFDIKSNDNLLKIYGAMQYWIDMAMSVNTYLNYNHYSDGKIPHSVIIKDIMSAYKYGIKTLYYNNTPDDRSEGMNIEENSCEGGACSI